MKIDFLLLSLSLFVSLSYADESAQVPNVAAAETAQAVETETNVVTEASVLTEEEIAQSASEPETASNDDLPTAEETTLVVEENTPVVEETTPVVEETTPVVEETTPAVEATAADASTEAEPEEITPSHPGEPYLELALGLYESCKSLGLILEQVNNMPSADAAAPEVAKLTDSILELLQSESMLPPPTLEIQQYVQERTSALNTAEVSEKALGRVIDLVTKTDPICYGSAALRSELHRLVRGLLGR